jgi:predicted TIM-barrel fold metal-dependent hydrolase
MSATDTLAVDRVPDLDPADPGFAVPAGACDAHFHVFDDPARYPHSPERYYTPALVTLADFARVRARLGLQRAVLVHPTVYGTDDRLVFDTLALDPSLRAVTVVDLSVTDAHLRRLDAAGVRGVRLTPTGPVPLDRIGEIAARIAPLGWHVQLWIPAATLVELAPRLAALPVPAVLDHFGGLTAAHAGPCAERDALLRLLGTGRVWAKLSAAYRASVAGPPYADLTGLAREMVATAPGRLVGGSDWPHSNQRGTPPPDTGRLLGLLRDWVPDAAARARILVDNPAELYRF